MTTPTSTTPTLTAVSDRYARPPGSTALRGPHVRMKAGLPSHSRPGHTVVALYGDLDFACAPALREHLRGTLRHCGRLLILDLGEVAFCDAAGLAVLIGTGRRAAGLGITLHLASPRPQVAKLLRVTGLDRVLTIVPSIQAEPAV